LRASIQEQPPQRRRAKVPPDGRRVAMATQVIEAGRRSRVGVVLIAMALVFAIAVVVAQASSIWSTGGVSTVQPGPVQYSLSAKEMKQLSSGISLPPPGCRVKFGCSHSTTTQP